MEESSMKITGRMLKTFGHIAVDAFDLCNALTFRVMKATHYTECVTGLLALVGGLELTEDQLARVVAVSNSATQAVLDDMTATMHAVIEGDELRTGALKRQWDEAVGPLRHVAQTIRVDNMVRAIRRRSQSNERVRNTLRAAGFNMAGTNTSSTQN